jgi:opacity protein-like surface antigen
MRAGTAIHVQRAWVAVLFFLLAPSLASATAPPLAQASRRTGKPAPSGSAAPLASGPDLFGGYSYTHAFDASLNGWEISGSFPFRGRLRFAADLSGHYGSFAGANVGQLSFLAGPRMAWRFSKVSPFAQILVGAVRGSASLDIPGATVSESHTHLGTTLGGGIDYRLSRRWAARAQAELLFLRADGAWDTDPRLALGAVYRFARK